MTQAPEIKIGALTQWYGSNREKTEAAGRELGKLDWCGVPFMGGLPELRLIQARSGVAADLHRHMVNLARVVRDPDLCAQAGALLDLTPFHEAEYRDCQERCRDREKPRFVLSDEASTIAPPDVRWAVDYFISSWMGPGGSSGKSQEFTRYFSSRWSSSGGASVTRFRSAVESLLGWSRVLSRWEFRVMDAFAFINEVDDTEGHGLYCDPPWPKLGIEYKCRFSDEDQAKLEKKLRGFSKTRVVVRFGDHPLIRELYQPPHWRWVEFSTRNQANNEVAEVLIVNGPSLTA